MSTPYHRLARETPAYAWWKLPVAGVIGVIGYLITSVVFIVAVMTGLYAVGRDGDKITDRWESASSQVELMHPGYFAMTMILIASMLPVILLAVLVTGPRPIGYLTSVEGRMRWAWLGHTTLLASMVFGGGLAALIGLSAVFDDGSVDSPSMSGRVLILLVLTFALTPFQAAAEEYVFRGYILQLVGSWTRFAWIPIVISVPVFASGHEYNIWGLIDVGLFGLLAAYLVVRTGGLEAGIAAHTANNVSIGIFEALGMIDTSEGGGPLDLVPSVVMNLLFLWLVERSLKRRTIARMRPPIAPPLQPVWTPVPVSCTPWYPPAPQAPAEWVPPPNTPPYPGRLPEGWRPPGS